MKIQHTLLSFILMVLVTTIALAQDEIAYHEAPMLAEMVAAGELPPVEVRLPTHPRIIPVFNEIGTYGGTLHGAYRGDSDRWGPTKLIEERILEFEQRDAETIRLVPGYIDAWSIEDGGVSFSFTLKEGLRWSDGEPVTTRDVQFWYEDIFLNSDLTPAISGLYQVNGEPLRIEIVDEYTFIVRFAAPYPLFPEILAKESTGAPGLDRPGFIQPFHYLSQFHPNYATQEALDAITAEYGVASWVELWNERGQIQSWWLNPDLPVITPWRIVVPPPADVIVMERNPYYYGVDEAGNQLPYIDRVEHRSFESNEEFDFLVLQGAIDAQGRHVSSDYVLYTDNAELGNYQVFIWHHASTDTLFPNLNVQDEVLASLYADSRFIQALNIAIDRNTINQLAASGLAEPRQASPVTGSPFYDAAYETLWTEYDPHAANALLDELGLSERDAEGFRLRPDGQRLSILIDTEIANDELVLVALYWGDVGIEVQTRVSDRDVFNTIRDNNEHQMFLYDLDRSSIVSADPRRYLGWEGCVNEYYKWLNSDGTIGIEPPADHWIRQAWTVWDNAKTASSLEEAHAFVQDLITVNRENNCFIGLIGETPSLFIVSNEIGNFPNGLTDDDTLRTPGNAHPMQWYLRQA